MRIHIQQALRRSLRAPGFALTVLLLVAAVVAVNATAFSALHALRWKALPYHEGDRLVELRADLRNFGFEVGLMPSLYERVRDDASVFAGAAGAATSQRRLNDEDGRDWRVTRVTHDFAQALGVAPALGRAFDEGEAAAGREQVLLLSDEAWRSRFAAAPDVAGRVVTLADERYTVIGVMPAGFTFPDAGVDAWMPFVASADERAMDTGGNVGYFEVAARLAPGATVGQARERLEAIFASAASVSGLRTSAGLVADARPWRDRFAAAHWQALALLQLAAMLLLVVVMANLGNLVVDRIANRRREFAICRALGARGRDVLSAVVGDILPPALAGFAAGIALLPFGTSLLRSRQLLPADMPVAVSGDLPTLLFAAAAAAIALGGALLFGGWLSLRRGDAGLGERARASGLGRTRVAMLAAQVALCVVLVGCTGLLLRSAINVTSQDPGFDPDGVLVTAVDPIGVTQGAHYDPAGAADASLAASVERLREAAAALPGVTDAAVSGMTPFSGWEAVSNFRLDGSAQDQQARSRNVGPRYFETLRIPIVQGRSFTAADTGEDAPVIVDEVFRDRYLDGTDPLQAYVQVPAGGETMRRARVVGVSRTVKHGNLEEDGAMPTYYVATSAPLPLFFLSLRTSLDPAALVEPLRRQVLDIAPEAIVVSSQPMSASIARTLTSRRALVEAIGLFAVLTVALAALGLYAVLSFAVRRRTSEIGVRMALGANRPRILRMVLGQGGAMIAAGVLLGIAAGIPLARLLADRLYRLTPGDPLTWMLTAAVVALAALFACWWPARRATRVPPGVALQSD